MSSNSITTSAPNDVITITTSGYSGLTVGGHAPSTYAYSGYSGNITIGGSTTIPTLTTAQISTLSTTGFNSINTSTLKIHVPVEFVDILPDIDRIKKMCDEYPGLKIAFEKFKTTYKLVKDHYDTPADQRPLP